MRKYLFFFLVSSFGLFAQEAQNTVPTIMLGGGVTSGTYTPFWLRANQYGVVPTEESYGTLGFEARAKTIISKRVDWSYGVSARINLKETISDVRLQEAYLTGRYGIFELQAGRKRQVQGLVDTTLSSGSYIWSANALPMPMLNLVVKDYWAPAFLKNVVGFKGNFAHGFFENSRTDVADFYLHQKSFYGRFGKPNWLFKFYGGFNHQVQWGGTLKYADPFNISAKNGKVATGPREFFYMITGRSMSTVGSDTAKYGINDGWNRLGNHLGTVDVGMEIDWKKAKLFFYRQSIYEDGSLYYLNNITDGLHGFSFTRKAKQGLIKVVLEYLNTTSQGGSGSSGGDNKTRGQDNYLNNGVYQNGWTYQGSGIGTPLMTLDSETDLNAGKGVFYDNSRIEAFYVGIEGMAGIHHVTLRGSLSNAIGSYGAEYVPVKKQISVGLQWQAPLVIWGQETTIRSNIGADVGQWKKDVFGGNISLSVPLY